jgi:RND family efflux transporter MFP subunit
MKATYFNRLSSFLVLLGIFALVIAGCESAAPMEKAKEVPRVTVAHPAVRSLVDEDDYKGWLQASQTVEVRARVRGHIAKIDFHDGDLVKEGQLLFELDPRPFQAAVSEALAQAHSLEAQKVAAQKNAKRVEELIKARAVSESEYEQVVADAQAYVARIEAQMQVVERCRLDLEYSRITAPISGRISRAMLTVGNLVNAGGSDPVLTTIVAVNPIYVEFNVSERAMQHYQEIGAERHEKDKPLRDLNIPFYFGLETEKGYPNQGKIIFADNKYSEGTGTIMVRGVASNTDGRLIPGSRASIRVPISDEYSATLVPDTAINTDQSQKYLLLVGDRNVVSRQNVTLGRLLDDGMRVILEPKLKPDAWVIVEGMERSRLNYPVEPIPESASVAASTAK